jgi:hypothetical protein
MPPRERPGDNDQQLSLEPSVPSTRGQPLDARHAATRADAAQLRVAPLSQLPDGQRLPLGGLPIDAEIRADRNRRPLVQLTLHGVPADPTTLEHRPGSPTSSPSLVRQLEHRNHRLPAIPPDPQRRRGAAAPAAPPNPPVEQDLPAPAPRPRHVARRPLPSAW